MKEKDFFKINQATLRLFKRYFAPRESSGDKLIPKEEGLKYGILLDQDISKELFDEVVKQYGIDGFILNQTFHKSLEKVAKEDIITLYIEQIVHYFTTYGYEQLEITDGQVYVPNENLEVPVLEEGTKLIYISWISITELKRRVTDLAISGIALSKQSVKDVVTLSDHITVDIEEIKNKEVRTMLYSKNDIVPKNNIEFLRFLIFKLTGSSLLIKDENTINKLKNSGKDEILKYLDQYNCKYGLIPLSEIFNRYKPLFLALKRDPKSISYSWETKSDKERNAITAKSINKIINNISKLSKNYHKPFIDNNKLSNFKKTIKDLSRHTKQIAKLELNDILNENSLYNVIKVGNYVNFENNQYSHVPSHAYKVRNGKVFVKEEIKSLLGDSWVNDTIKENIIRRIRKNVGGKTIFIPKDINYALPQSEKQFIGNIPFNSSVDFDKNKGILVGIHWLNLEDNRCECRVDLDLKLVSNKYQIGWNTLYRDENRDLLFTGDVTDAKIDQGGACEYIYVDGNLENTIMTFKVNNYTIDVGDIPFEIIIAYAPSKDKVAQEGRNYIVDPKDIICKVPAKVEKGQAEHSIGILSINDYKNTFIFTDLSTGNLPVSKNNKLDEMLRTYLIDYKHQQYDLENILKESGAIISDEPYTENFVEYVLIQDGKETNMIKRNELEDASGIILEEGIFKKEKVPVNIDLSIEALNKTTIIDIFKEE